jgi:hypothetical protein
MELYKSLVYGLSCPIRNAGQADIRMEDTLEVVYGLEAASSIPDTCRLPRPDVKAGRNLRLARTRGYVRGPPGTLPQGRRTMGPA